MKKVQNENMQNQITRVYLSIHMIKWKGKVFMVIGEANGHPNLKKKIKAFLGMMQQGHQHDVQSGLKRHLACCQQRWSWLRCMKTVA